MRKFSRLAEALQSLLIAAGFLFPLVYFFSKMPLISAATQTILTNQNTWNAAAHSLLICAVPSTLSTVLGFVFSWILWRYHWNKKASRITELLLKTPYFLPPFFLAMGWVALAAPRAGYLTQLSTYLGFQRWPSIYGLGGTCFVLTLWSTALSMIQLQGFFKQFPGSLEDAAITCGASPARSFMTITVPLAKPHLVSCWLLTAVANLAAFGVPALLASPHRQYVLTTRIYQSIKGTGNFEEASILSLVLIFFTMLILGAQWFLMRSPSFSLVSGKALRPAALKPRRVARLFFAFAFFWGTLSCLMPFLALLLQSFLRDRSDITSFTLEKYKYVFFDVPDGLRALGNSLTVATIAAVGITILGLFTSYGALRLRHKWARALGEGWSLGYAIPGTIIAMALLMFYAGSLTDTLWILALAYVVKYAAFSLRTIGPALSAISLEMEEAAWMCGAKPMRGFTKILIPLLTPALSAAFLLSLVPMLSELTMSIFLIGAGTETIGTLIYRFMEYADPGAAAVFAVLLVATTLGTNSIVRYFSKGQFGI